MKTSGKTTESVYLAVLFVARANVKLRLNLLMHYNLPNKDSDKTTQPDNSVWLTLAYPFFVWYV